MQSSLLATPFPSLSVRLAVKKTVSLFYHMHPKAAPFFFSLTLLCHHNIRGLDLRALLTETHEYSLSLPNYYGCFCCPITASVSI